MKKLLTAILAAISIFSSFTCDSTEPTDSRIISLEAVDASCTEAWLNVTLQNVPFPAKTILTRNDSLVGEFDLFSADTIIIDEGLNPSTNYNFKLSLADGSINSASSIRTMDTTSHNFTWQTWEFGAKSSSTFYDVAIINENNIWAVGEIYTEDTYTYDSNGVWQEIYNAAHWDGSNWELKRIEYFGDCSAVRIPPLYAIAAFSDTSMIISQGGSAGWFNGETVKLDCKINPWLKGKVNKIWASDINNIYLVGNKGSIVRYDGKQWINLGSVSDLDIYDIWGDYDEKTGNYEIIAVAAKLLQSTDRDIFKIVGNNVFSLDEKGIEWPLNSVWFKTGKKYLVSGSGVYEKPNINQNNWDKLNGLSNYYVHSIRGLELNDIFLCGAFNEVWHFNGNSWFSYKGKINSSETGRLTKLMYNDITCCIVGTNDSKAIIYLGKK